MSERTYDLVLYGATGFTGTQAALYLAAHAPEGVRWAVAGRNPSKLAALLHRLGRSEIGSIVADSNDAASVADMAKQTRVLITTAGPYAKYGDPVVEACVEHRTHYADITGETPWVRSLIDRFHERARSEGTRIVPCCGFDSIPSDLGCLMVVDWIREEWGQGTRRVQGAFVAGRAAPNGGTLDSAFTMAENGQLDQARDVLLLNPPEARTEAERARSADRNRTSWDPDLGRYLAPFFMAPVNTRVVRRSNALYAAAGRPYGEAFAYGEALELKSRLAAAGVSLTDRILTGALDRRPLRRLLKRFAPDPGEGPSEQAMASGWFRARFVGEAEDGRKALGVLSGKGDPANRATTRMLCEAGLALALDTERLPTDCGTGGVLTPATALGHPLADRLLAAGMRLEVAPLHAAT